MIKVQWDALLEAFDFVNSAPAGENSARLSLASGEIRRDSVWTDLFDAGPAEAQENGDSLAIPHKTQLGLGRDLVLCFVEAIIPDHSDDVADFFQKRGAYARFKALLAEEGLLQQWYQFEREAEEQGLRTWCEENRVQPA